MRSAARPLLIANQLGDRVNGIGRKLARELPRRLPNIRFVDVPAGDFPAIPAEAEILFPWRLGAGGRSVRDSKAPPPAGWPYGLKWVQLLGVGSDGYPRWLFDGPTVTCMRGPAGRPLAEYALAAILADLKQIPQSHVHARAQWTHRPTRSVHGAALGIVGFGPVGRTLAEYATVLGMTVRALRRTEAPFGVAGVERAADLADLFARSDFVVLAAPSTPATDQIVNDTILAQARPGLHLINVARGSLVDHDALSRAIGAGIVRRATLDTTEPEPLPDGHPFYTHPSVALTAHSANGTEDFEAAVIDTFERNIRDYLADRPLRDVVDVLRGY